MSLIPRGDTVVQWIAPDGAVTALHGPQAHGVVIGMGPEGFGPAEVDDIFEAAARQHGETWVGYTLDHAEIDFPLHVLADSPQSLSLAKNRVERQFDRFRPGWLAFYSDTGGWRWVAARKQRMTPLVERDAGMRSEVTYELVLTVESPLAREADDTSEWVNRGGSGRGDLYLYPGDGEWPAWPQFVLRGPGVFRLRWAGNDMTLPRLNSDEWALFNTDQARTTLRSRDVDGVDRNLWPQMSPGARVEHPLPVRQVSRVDVQVTGGSAQSSAWATVPVQREGLA